LDEVKFGLIATVVKGVDEIMPGAVAEWEIYQSVTVRVKQFRWSLLILGPFIF
jgi:hypothetical protein